MLFFLFLIWILITEYIWKIEFFFLIKNSIEIIRVDFILYLLFFQIEF